MTSFNEREFLISTAEYNKDFWNAMRGNRKAVEKIQGGRDMITSGYTIPINSEKKLQAAIGREGLFRNICTVVNAFNGDMSVYATDCEDYADWVPEGGNIPIYDGINDFERYTIDCHKLDVFVKLDDDFINDAAFSVEKYLTERLAKNFARAEDRGFVTGDGIVAPTGILCSGKGAEIGVSTDNFCLDDVCRLFFSLKDEYRKNAVWLMNDETALDLRLAKDENGNYLWNHNNDTILGKPVYICNDMPSAESGSMPIAFGDFRYYWIVLRRPVSVRTLKEKFITRDQVGYLAQEFLDGKLIRREAIHTLKIN